MNPSGGRDVLVVLREELVAARASLDEAWRVYKREPLAGKISDAALKLSATADALEGRIRAPFDGVLLDRAAGSFRVAASALGTLLDERRAARRTAPEILRVQKRFVAHARDIGKLTHQRGADHVGAAMTALGQPEGWVGPPLDALVELVDTLLFLGRNRLGDAATDEQLSSLIDRAASTAMVSSLHALKDLAQRAQSEPKVMRDRFALTSALKASSHSVVERLTQWFSLDGAGQELLDKTVERFAHRLLDRLAATPDSR